MWQDKKEGFEINWEDARYPKDVIEVMIPKLELLITKYKFKFFSSHNPISERGVEDFALRHREKGHRSCIIQCFNDKEYYWVVLCKKFITIYYLGRNFMESYDAFGTKVMWEKLSKLECKKDEE